MPKLSDEALEKALKDGDFEKVYKEIFSSEIREKITQSQARKFLEIIREAKENRGSLKNIIIKALVLLEYQSKRGAIKPPIKSQYEQILKKALELSETKEIGKNLYTLIEMLTIRFYGGEG
jgi:CRISPR/Cas system CSM-associated protein Csm2 small subunit